METLPAIEKAAVSEIKELRKVDTVCLLFVYLFRVVCFFLFICLSVFVFVCLFNLSLFVYLIYLF